MPGGKQSPRIPLLRHWAKHVGSAVLHVISLAQYAAVYTRSWAVDSMNCRVRLRAQLDRARQEIALLRETIRIKKARMACIAPLRRPHCPPTERMAILELRTARGWSLQQTAELQGRVHFSGKLSGARRRYPGVHRLRQRQHLRLRRFSTLGQTYADTCRVSRPSTAPVDRKLTARCLRPSNPARCLHRVHCMRRSIGQPFIQVALPEIRAAVPLLNPDTPPSVNSPRTFCWPKTATQRLLDQRTG